MKVYAFYVYIMTNFKNGTIYIGFTGNLGQRTLQHKAGKGGKFTSKYELGKLVYKEFFQYADKGIAREKQLKTWNREWKVNLIQQHNPEWIDLAKEWYTDKEIEEYKED
jgi:putative endonuclease|uniref:GIY-YIG nuclease family protein n=1 Tax=Nonlabens sp. Ci31 TaxID=2608253 RepID=UPI001F0DBC93|nr:GIY-YIG nuclease family protein [Nonlabens sp. Ci31]